ncbi:hypothetical protein SLEP1_g53218 [Rubroshorea leprosula]|uniref:F-box domain-containing protein n=1 Tax=Rubroshorea leprosula TaxID=152421 RepID=A0AAV5M8S7_9ROSI|nr:hypothetical protein SLEP1_g53218 [Rubroshorea leprosula]
MEGYCIAELIVIQMAQQTQFAPDLIEVILLRLGVKSLLRFKCLSKQWFLLLSNQQFITRRLKIQTSICTHQEFIVQSSKDSNLAVSTLNANADRILFPLLETNCLQHRCLELVNQGTEEISGTTMSQKNFERFGFSCDSEQPQSPNMSMATSTGLLIEKDEKNEGLPVDLARDRMGEEESLSWTLSNDFKMCASLELSGDSLCLTKLFRVHSTDGNFNTPLYDETNWDVMSPVCFTSNVNLIFSHERDEYAIYDANDQSVNKVAEFGNRIVGSWPMSPYVESLVSLGAISCNEKVEAILPAIILCC